MDFAELEVEENKAGFWVHLKLGDKPLYLGDDGVGFDETDKPCRVRMKSAASNDVYAAFQKYNASESAHKMRVSRASDKDLDKLAKQHVAKSEDLMDDLIIVAVEGWENIHFNGKAEKPTPEFVRILIDRNASHSKREIRGQLFNAITEKRENLTDAA